MTSTAGLHLQSLITSNNNGRSGTPTIEQKLDCVKLLKVVVKNLSDATKSTDAKYRQLRLSNDKVRQKIMPCSPTSIDYLKSMGFVHVKEGTDEYLKLPDTTIVNVTMMSAELKSLENAMKVLGSTTSATKGGGTTGMMSRSSSSFEEEKKSTTSPPSSGNAPKMSEKQKARLLLEEKKRKEAQADKESRKRNVAMLKQDKYVRENDPNWKSGVSAACAKSGDGISTFRDRHGES